MLEANGAEVSEIRLPDQLDDVDGLIIPGGESTTIVQLIDIYGFRNKLVDIGTELLKWINDNTPDNISQNFSMPLKLFNWLNITGHANIDLSSENIRGYSLGIFIKPFYSIFQMILTVINYQMKIL